MVTNTRKPRRPSSPLPWVIAAAAGVGLALVLMMGGGKGGKASHPDPRPEASTLGETVMPASFFTDNPKVVQTYQAVRAIPEVLDGLYCNCHCKEEAGHRSLLTCFQSQHGAGCDICLGEAQTALEMHAQGKSLAEIRSQIDMAFSH